MAAWRAPLRGVDWTAPHPAINKLAEREQPRDEPFNSATFCPPPALRATSSPLATASTPPSTPPPLPPPWRLIRCSSTVTLAISDSARALPFCSATEIAFLAYCGLSRTNGHQRDSMLFRIFLRDSNRAFLPRVVVRGGTVRNIRQYVRRPPGRLYGELHRVSVLRIRSRKLSIPSIKIDSLKFLNGGGSLFTNADLQFLQ